MYHEIMKKKPRPTSYLPKTSSQKKVMLNLTYAPSTSQADSCASHKSFSCQIIFIQPYSIKRPTFSCLKDHRFLQWADAENASTDHGDGGAWKEFDGPDVLYVLLCSPLLRSQHSPFRPPDSTMVRGKILLSFMGTSGSYT